MTAATVPAVYATALLDLATERGKLDPVVVDVRELLAAFEADPALVTAVDAPGKDDEFTAKVLHSSFDGKLEPELVDFLCLLCDRGRFAEVVSVLKATVAEADRRAGRVAVSVTSAAALDDANQSRIDGLVRKRFGAGATITYTVDPTLLGGFRVRVGDTLVDASAERHLEAMRRLIVSAPVDDGIWEAADEAAGGADA